MKLSRAAAPIPTLCLLLACSQWASCSVKVIELSESSQQPQITVLLNGAAQKDVKLEIYKGFPVRDKPLLVLLTDENGQAVLPALQPGKYALRASPNRSLLGELYLDIKSATERQKDRFSMQLEPYDHPPTFEELVVAAEQSSAAREYAEFSGVVVDQSRGRIPGVSIDVVIRGTKGTEHVRRLRSDNLGRFSADLPDGNYVAAFSSPGFKVQYIPLTITKSASDNNMHVVLDIGEATE